MRITVNLATRPFTDLGPILKKLRIGMGVLAGVAILLGVGLHLLGSRAAAARARITTVDFSLTRVRNERQGYQAMMQQPANAQVLDESEALNKLIDEKSFSWTLAMEDLETVLPGGVQVTTLEPTRDKKDGHITVRLRVIGPRDKAVELVKNLEHSRRFIQPRIVGETAESANSGPNQALEPVSASNRVNFDVLADYNPATPEERKVIAKKATETAGQEEGQNDTFPAPHRVMMQGQSRPPYTGPAPHRPAGGAR